MKKRTSQRLARSVLALAPAGLELLRKQRRAARSRRRNKRIARIVILAASGVAAFAGVRKLRQRRLGSVQQERPPHESEIDERIAESFPASDPPWQP